MTYRDIYEYLADRRCAKCDKPLDRNGLFCSACTTVLQDEFEQAEAKEVRTAMVNKPIHSMETKAEGEQPWATLTLDTWRFLDNEFQKIFGPRK